MNYNDLIHCLSLSEDFISAFKTEKSKVDVSIINYQKGVNAPLEQKLRLTTSCHNTDIAFEVMPKRSEPDA